jgi:hypothetical protein
VSTAYVNDLVAVPLSQVKSLYTALDSNKENHKPLGKDMNVKESGSKKTQKKQPEKKKEVIVKPPIPKSLEMAGRLVSHFIGSRAFISLQCYCAEPFIFQLKLNRLFLEKRRFSIDDA